jgi:hypothetical protein
MRTYLDRLGKQKLMLATQRQEEVRIEGFQPSDAGSNPTGSATPQLTAHDRILNAMTEEQEAVLMIRGAVISLPAEERHQVDSAYQRLVDMEQELPPASVRLAIALRGAELAATE